MSTRRGIDGGYVKDKVKRVDWASKAKAEPKPQKIIKKKTRTVK